MWQAAKPSIEEKSRYQRYALRCFAPGATNLFAPLMHRYRQRTSPTKKTRTLAPQRMKRQKENLPAGLKSK
jgi:hypothetical protein